MFELLIAALTGARAANIRVATIYEALSIDKSMKKKNQHIIKSLWQNCIIFIIDKINIISLKLLSTIDSQLNQKKKRQ